MHTGLTVAIVGGGLSGLSCAAAILAESPSTRVIVFESNARIGGRTASARSAVAAADVDLGGQWVGPRQARVLALVRDLGLTLQPQFCSGRRVIHVGTRLRTYAGLIPDLGVAALVDAQLALLLVSFLQMFVSCGCWRAIMRALDNTSMAALTASCMWTAGGRALVRIIVQAFIGAEPEAVSVLAFCRYVNASGSVEKMSEVGPGSLQAWTLAGGAGQLAAGLASRVCAAGGEVRLLSRVASIDRCAGGLLIRLASGGAPISADHVVFAAPPPLLRCLTFMPPLPPERAALASSSQMGCIIKSILVFRTAFWRAAGFSGEAVCDAREDSTGGPCFNLFDGCAIVDEGASPGDGAGGGEIEPAYSHFLAPSVQAWVDEGRPPSGAPAVQYVAGTHPATGAPARLLPALVAFINGERATAWSPRGVAARREAVTRQISRWFGGAEEALEPLEVLEMNWAAHPHTGGCPTAVYALGALADFGAASRLAAPAWRARGRVAAHRLHFASTETAAADTGFMCGALTAGERAAKEVLVDARRIAAASADAASDDDMPAASSVVASGIRAPPLTAPLL